MDAVTPAGGLSKKDIRRLLIRGTTFASVSIVVYATVMTYAVKHSLKHLAAWHWLVLALPVVGFLLKKLFVWAFTRFRILGVPATDKRHPDVREFVRSVARWHGLPEPDAVGIGSSSEVTVSAVRSGPLKMVGIAKQRSIVKVGAPLLTTMTAAQLAVVVSYHLAVLAEPLPIEASALIQRRDDFASARPGTRKAARAEAFGQKVARFNADVNARGWERALRAANGSQDAVTAAFALTREVTASFGIVESRLRTLLQNRKPVPAQFHNAWAGAWRSGHPIPPGQAPVVDRIERLTERSLARQWTNLQTMSREAMTMALGLATGAPGGGANRKSRLVSADKFDFSRLLAGIGRPEQAVPAQQTWPRHTWTDR